MKFEDNLIMTTQKTCMYLIILLLFCFFAGHSLLFAYEPPTPSIASIIKDSKLMFVGRVVQLTEVKRDSFQTISVAKIKIIDCLFGADFSSDQEILLHYCSDTIQDRAFSLNLLIGNEYLFLLNHNLNGKEANFNSGLDHGIDFAFQIDVEDSISNFNNKYLSKTDKIGLTNLYWPKQKEWINKIDIQRMVKEKDCSLVAH